MNKSILTSFIAAGSIFTGNGQIPEKKPNILLIMTDPQTSWAMSHRIGERYLKTPNMDYLSHHGITFTRAYCSNPLCIPSRSSMFTGRYPHETGIQTNDNKKIDPAEFPSLGTIFRNAGYETGYVGKWHLPFPQNDPESHGFGYMEHIKGSGVDSLIPVAAGDFIARKHDNPSLLVTCFCNPHNICEWARGQKLPDGPLGQVPPLYSCPPVLPNSAPSMKEGDIMQLLRESYHASPTFPVGNFDEVKWRQYRWAYFRMIEKVDAEIGLILEKLRESGQDKNTLIVFLADHGDAQGAHGWNQKTVLFEEVVNVPFIVCPPGINKPKSSEKLIQTGTDLIPTLCDFAGIPVPENLTGVSALKIAEGKIPQRDYVVVSDKLVQGEAVNGYKPEPDGRMVRSERYKYWIYSEGNQRESLFDFKKDPGETVNLASDPKYKNVLEQHRKYLAEWCAGNKDLFLQSSAQE